MTAGRITSNSRTSSFRRSALALQQGDKYTQARAAENLKSQKAEMEKYSAENKGEANAQVLSEIDANDSLNFSLQTEAAKLEQAQKSAVQNNDLQRNGDNRVRMNTYYNAKKTTLANDVVINAGSNWDYSAEQKPAEDTTRLFDKAWVEKNKLSKAAAPEKGSEVEGDMKGVAEKSRIGGRDSITKLKAASKKVGIQQKPSAAQVLAPTNGYSQQGEVQLGPSANRSLQTLCREYNAQRGQQQAVVDQSGDGLINDSISVERYKAKYQQELEYRQMVPHYNAPTRQSSGQGGIILNRIAGPAVMQQPPAPQPEPAADAFATPANQPAATPATPSMTPPPGIAPAPPGLMPPGGMMPPVESPAPKHSLIVQEDEDSGVESLYTPNRRTADTEGVPAKKAAATGMASLDFELPTGGVLYRFTTPRGDKPEITARNVSNELLIRLGEMAFVVVALLVIWSVAKLARRGGFRWTAQPSGSTVLICVGLLSLCGGVLPVLGLLVAITGCGLKIHRAACATRVKPQAVVK